MEKKYRPLNRSITIACAIIFLLLSTILSVATYRLFSNAMYRRYQEQMTSIMDYAQTFIDNEDMAVCAKTYVETDKYRETQAAFDNFVDHYSDLHYLYIMKATESGDSLNIRSVCSASTAYEKANTPETILHLGDGAASWYSGEVIKVIEEIQNGNEDVFFVDQSEWGLDYTLARPLTNAAGEHYGVLCVDNSIDAIRNTINRNTRVCIGLILALGALFNFMLVLWMRACVTDPIRQLEASVTAFAASSHGKRDPDELLFTPPEIKINNEVQSLNLAVSKMTTDMKDYAQGLVEAEKTVQELRDSVARDELTHVNLEAAYVKMEQKLDRKIADGVAEFAVVIVDLDDTGDINNKYGYKKGDEYIAGSCLLVCNAFQHSPVYRVGGDEFAVVLEGRDYRDREALVTSLKKDFEQSPSRTMTKQPWLCYSGTIGMSEYLPGRDPSAKYVYTRAVSNMVSTKKEEKGKTQAENVF